MAKSKIQCSLKNQPQAATDILQLIEKVQRRKEDTRKKILVGAYIIDKHERTGTTEILLEELDTFLSRKQDRELFGLPSTERCREEHSEHCERELLDILEAI
jgi:hypothetical protein